MRLRSFRALAPIAAATVILLAQSLRAQDSASARPEITGISHTAYFTTNLNKTIAFWHDLLGFDEFYHVNKPGTSQIRIAFIKINDHQYIEVFNEPSPDPPNMMSHICFTVRNVEQMRAYLRSRGFNVKPGNGKRTKTGDYGFEIRDPDGTHVEFIQPLPTGLELRDKGKFLPPHAHLARHLSRRFSRGQREKIHGLL